MIAQARKHAIGAGDDFEVWEENWDSLLFFLNVSTQWNVVAGMGGLFYIGLNHTAIESEMNMRGIRKQRRAQLCDDLLMMERAALPLLNKRD